MHSPQPFALLSEPTPEIATRLLFWKRKKITLFKKKSLQNMSDLSIKIEETKRDLFPGFPHYNTHEI
jgi:hypothetical protein